MTLRDEIKLRGRGTVKWLVNTTRLSKPTIINALKGRNCTPETAADIATAVGEPERWPELVILRKRRVLYRATHISPQEPAA